MSFVPQTRNNMFLFVVAGFVVKQSKLVYMVSSTKNVRGESVEEVIV